MTQATHPIGLTTILFTRSVVIAIADHVPDPDRPITGPENNIRVNKADEGGQYTAVMTSVLNPNKEKWAPYSIDMECIALLTADQSLTDVDAQRGVMITANSVLFGAIRESVAWLTARQPHGPLVFGLSVLQSTAKVSE